MPMSRARVCIASRIKKCSFRCCVPVLFSWTLLSRGLGLASTRAIARMESDQTQHTNPTQKQDMPTLMAIMDAALEKKLDRKSTFVALGGGVIGDMVGFAAAIYQRGVNFVQVHARVSGGGVFWGRGRGRGGEGVVSRFNIRIHM